MKVGNEIGDMFDEAGEIISLAERTTDLSELEQLRLRAQALEGQLERFRRSHLSLSSAVYERLDELQVKVDQAMAISHEKVEDLRQLDQVRTSSQEKTH